MLFISLFSCHYIIRRNEKRQIFGNDFRGLSFFVKEKPGKCKKNVKKYSNAGEICAIVGKNV